MELVTSRVLDEPRYVAEHRVSTRTIGGGESVLFRTEDGYEIATIGWSSPPR